MGAAAKKSSRAVKPDIAAVREQVVRGLHEAKDKGCEVVAITYSDQRITGMVTSIGPKFTRLSQGGGKPELPVEIGEIKSVVYGVNKAKDGTETPITFSDGQEAASK